MATESNREESNQDPPSTVGGEEEKVVVEEQGEEEKIPDEEERAGEDEVDPSEDDDEEKSELVKFEGGVVKGEQAVEGDKKNKEKQCLKEKGDVPRTPTSERPSRERKTVERYTEIVSPRSSASKPVSVVQGRGTQLKDIPNVAFKLSKRKADDTLQTLHAILFGKKGKAQMLKRNINMFSGFTWDENEKEKQRAKVKEKLDKCVKEKLLDFVDILNIPGSRSAIKKEELSAKLLEFLEAPHVTTDTLLAEKKTKKRKAKSSVSKTSGLSGAASKKSRKKKEKDSPAGEKSKQPSKGEDEEVDDKSEHSDSADKSMEDADGDVVAQMGINKEQNDAKGKCEVEEEEPKEQLQRSKTAKKKVKKDSRDKDQEKSNSVRKELQEKASKSPAKSPKTSSVSKSNTFTSEGDSALKVSSANHGKLKKEKKKDPSNSQKENVSGKKQTSDATKAFGKDQGKKAKSSKPAKAEPTTAEMHEVVAEILKEVDFNTATLSDILRQVGKHFGFDLSHRKSEVKGIITDIINNMPDDDLDDDDDDNNDDKDEDHTDEDDDNIIEKHGKDEDEDHNDDV